MAYDSPDTGGGTLPLPNNLHSGSGSSSGPDLVNMANGLQKRLSRASAARSHGGSTAKSDKWWKIHLFRGMINDIRRRAPFYWSDFKDAWDYRVVPATIYMYFAKYDLPFSLYPTSSINPFFSSKLDTRHALPACPAASRTLLAHAPIHILLMFTLLPPATESVLTLH